MAFLAKTQPLIERGEIKVWSTGSKSALPNNEGFFFLVPGTGGGIGIEKCTF